MNDAVALTDETFLASAADLVSVLSRLADPRDRRSARKREEIRWATDAFTQLFPQSLDERAHAETVRAIRPAEPVKAERQRPVVTAIELQDHAHRSHHRTAHCRCGVCRWCLDNARWERIFSEKFADPTYYEGLRYRRASPLAGAR